MPTEFTFDVGPITDLIDAAESNARHALAAGLDRMAVAAKALAPVGETGLLRGSIRMGEVAGSLKSGDLHGYVSATAPGAEAHEFGSGLHGERAAKYEIRPKNKRFLRFPVGGSVAGGDEGFNFARKVMHPGVRAKAYLQGGVEAQMSSLADEMAAAIALGKP